MAESASGRVSFAAKQPAGKMKRILRSDWLHERVPERWFRKKKKFSSVGHITNPLLTKLVRSRWPDIGLVLFCVFINLEFVSVNLNAKKNEAIYSHLDRTSLVNNA